MKRNLLMVLLLVLSGAMVYGGVLAVFPSVLRTLPLAAASDVPAAINHQGVVSVSGIRFTGSGQFRFAIVDPDTGNNVWTNDGTELGTPGTPTDAVSLSVADGIYSVALGDAALANMTAIPSTLFSDGNLKLRIWFDDGTNGNQQLSPDHKLTSVPYALAVADGSISSAKVQDEAVTRAKLASDVAIVPVGSLIATARSTAPDGWLLCDGSVVSRTTYAELFAAIGVSYGAGDGSTTFNLPDLRGRVPMGAGQGVGDGASGSGAPSGASLSSRSPGDYGGKETHTLTTAQMPSHSHVIQSFDGANTSVLVLNDHSGDRILSTDNATNGVNGEVKNSRYSTNSSGSGQAHNIVQPFQAVHWIIRH